MIKLLPAFSLLFFSTILYAQNKMITGVVTSKQDGQPLIGVNIVEKGTSKGATTDIDGKFSLEIQPGADTLEFSYLGYEKQTEAVGRSHYHQCSVAAKYKSAERCSGSRIWNATQE